MFPPVGDAKITARETVRMRAIVIPYRGINGDFYPSTDAQTHDDFWFFLCRFHNRSPSMSCRSRFFLRCCHFCFQDSPPCLYNTVSRTETPFFFRYRITSGACEGYACGVAEH
jgi:hypothetical protein